MTKKQNDSGVDYTLTVCENKWQPRIIFWLGFRPFKNDELVQLIPNLTAKQLDKELHALQNLRVVNPVLDAEDKYSLSNDGYDLRNMIVSMGVWGRQQLDDTADKISGRIVEPEKNAKLADLISYSKKLEEYL